MDDAERDKKILEMHDALIGNMLANPPRPGIGHNLARLMEDVYGTENHPEKGLMHKVEWVLDIVKTFSMKYKMVAGVAGVIGLAIWKIAELVFHK